ncbi:MAG: hypothetical protein D6689_21720 [Deltaproteobacteria bacterium]|nr:MAG: hypothetical protein D6689_21720 [Deltaproteobacteria bacterium]
MRQRWLPVSLAGVVGSVAAGLMVATVVRAAGPGEPTTAPADSQAPEARARETVAPAKPRVVVNRRAAGLKYFPCSECHDKIELRTPTTPPRPPHDRMTFKHMPGIEMCVQCHVRDDMDSLQLFTEEKISFDESDRLCGQCHPEKHADWELGSHGKVVGSWRGTRVRYTCADCHPPHEPAYRHTPTLPPPPFPRFGIRKTEPSHE